MTMRARESLLIFLCIALPLGVKAAEPARSRRLVDQWARADRNGDGRLSREEARAMPKLAAGFDAIDRNADGFLDADEVRASRRRPKAAARPRDPAWFTAADANGDGALDRIEVAQSLSRVAGRFEAIDHDGDGRLTPQEFAAWSARRKPAR